MSTETEKRQTYGQHLMQCVDGYCDAREKLLFADMKKRFGASFEPVLNYLAGNKDYNAIYHEVLERRKACEQAIDEIIREFHCPPELQV